MIRTRPFAAALFAAALGATVAGCEEDVTQSEQTGYRGTGMVQFTTPAEQAALAAANVVPEALPPSEPDPEPASNFYENLQVLGHLSNEEFLRTMSAITEWIAPVEGCGYCHNLENLAEDSVYTKVVARRMIQMTQAINTAWTSHVGETGVTCYTCHRGQPVPAYGWYLNPGPREAQGMATTDTGQNLAEPSIGRTSLPYDPYAELLTDPAQIAVTSPDRLPPGSGKTIQQTERTYALMIHMSEGLGVNCTYCHNTQNFASWSISRPQRVTAWHGLRMVPEINGTYITPLADIFPEHRKGVLGDPLKTNCETCHQGAPKPLLGVSMLKDYVDALGAPGPTQ